MKALVYTGPESLDFRDVDDPAPQPGHAIVRVEAAGICGSDMHAYLGHDPRRPAPLILGHEAAGTVVSGSDEGARVVINPLVTCGTCKACRTGRANLCADRQIISMAPRPGAFAEFVAVPETNLIKIPNGTPVDEAAMIEPIACGWHAVQMGKDALKAPLDRSRCLILGGGAIGVGAALVLTANGVRDILIAEPSAARRTVLEEAAGFRAYDPSHAIIADAAWADLVIDAVGIAKTREAASASVAPGGVIVHIGLGEATCGLDLRRMTLQEVTFIGTYTYTPDDFRATADAVFDDLFGPFDWIETRPLRDGGGAFRDLHAGQVSAPKIVLHP